MTTFQSVKLQGALYRCVAITSFVCLLIVVNLLYELKTLPTAVRIRSGGNSSTGSLLQPSFLNAQQTDVENLLKGTVRHIISFQLCYHPTTFNRTAFMTLNDDTNSTLLHSQDQQDAAPKIIWLMSFPNSGTTYTLKYVQGSTLTTTATNYGGNEQVGYDNSISIDEHRNEYGPFLRYPDRPYSCNSILTKTHCHQDATLSNNISHFMNSCRMGNRNVNGTNEEITYDLSTRVHSVVHLIRNPFDNIVARMHYKHKQWLASNSSKEHELAEYVTFSPEGFLRWCHFIQLTEQKHYYSHFSSTFWATFMEPLPCAIEFYKYFHWHHYTTEGVRSTIHNPSMILYYEDYSTQFSSTTTQILQFLQLEQSLYATTPEFIVGKTYTDWFTDEMKDNVKRLALAVVSNETWKLLHHYFEN